MPDMPETLCRFVLGASGGRRGSPFRVVCEPLASLTCKFNAGSDWCCIEAGVTAPLEGPVPWLLAPPSLLSSVVDWSVRKLALERRRKLFKNVGAMLSKRVSEMSARGS